MNSFLKTLKNRQASSEEGFSLTELTITILIIGILAAIAIPVYTEQQKTAMRAQVDTDMMNSAQSLSSWQLKQEGYLAIPTAAVFDSQIRVRSDAQTTVTLLSQDWGDSTTRQFCVQASKNIGGTVYQVHYQVNKKTKGTGPCPAFVQETQEVYG